MHVRKRNTLTICLAALLAALLIVGGCNDSATPAATTETSTAAPTQAETVELNVSAAASMTDVLQAINDLYMQRNENVTIAANFASSGTLQKQIEQGAPADVFISAAARQMNVLQEGGLIIDTTRRDLLNNRVVLVVPRNSTLNITDFMDLLNEEFKQVAIGDPEFVPAGNYGQQAFELLGIYEKIQGKLILGIDVRQVLAYVESGNVDAGIVYATDATITDGVRIAADAPEEVNIKIVYPVAVISDSHNVVAAKAYIAFLCGDKARAVFERYGFSVVNE